MPATFPADDRGDGVGDDGAENGRDGTEDPRADLDVDEAFARIVQHLELTASDPTGDARADTRIAAPPATTPTTTLSSEHLREARAAAEERERVERARRRALRRAERAAEVEAYEAEQARIEAERAADQEHFTPPEPPPVPRPRRRTIGAIALLAAGMFLLFGPVVLTIGPEAVVVLAFCCIVGGVALLVSGLRRRHPDNDADGWDDGAVV